MRVLLQFIKKEIVLVVAIVLAVLSSIWNPPSKTYLEFIDFRVLGILLSLMLVMAGLQENGVFHILGRKLVGRCTNTRRLGFVLVFLCFFSSMFLTNDVALITFVPFAILTLQMTKKEKMLIPIVTAQTIGANLGSMLTPMGNPQNLYLYGLSKMSFIDFLCLMLPYTIVAGIVLLVFVLVQKKENLSLDLKEENKRQGKWNKRQVIIDFILFGVCISTVLRLVEWYVVLGIVISFILIMDWRVLKKADYCLLFTFIGFFIFIGNIGAISSVRDMLLYVLNERETLIAIGASQIISNVPAAILLSGFTKNYEALIIGTNLGGLGTLIASMASLISYKQLVNAFPEQKGKYVLYFTVANVLFLIVLLLV
ncbi:MAG: anion permease [Lachnospiraceae bacterium]|nr:anion permease [Lachnospiraceae bacterium]